MIAEIGVNHDGDVQRALELVDAAADAGADAVKVQWFRASNLLSSSAELVTYQRNEGETDVASMLARLELSNSAMAQVLQHIHTRQMLGIATVFSLEDVDSAIDLPWDVFKTASPDLINKPLIRALSRTGRPLIMSTGGATMKEVSDALSWVESAPVALLHCVSSYPTPINATALGAISVLEELHVPVGYSDHTTEISTGGLAVACGATILEKHLTWNNQAHGPDHSSSLEPSEFEEYVSFARTARVMIGEREKQPLDFEIEVVNAARQSVAASHDLQAGSLLQEVDLTTMRPGNGFPPSQIDELIGRKLARDVKRGGLLAIEDLVSQEETK